MSDKQSEFRKLPKMMDCPYHNCPPSYSARLLSRYLGYEHNFYCEHCRKDNPRPSKYNSFGYGFTSLHSKSAALANWNKGVHRRQMRMMKEAIMHGV